MFLIVYCTTRLKRFLELNEKTGIERRPSVSSYESGFGCQPQPPDIKAIDAFYRQAGVDLAVRACRRALRDGGCTASEITHSVAVRDVPQPPRRGSHARVAQFVLTRVCVGKKVTATNHGCPGYDVLVADKLGLAPTAEATLLHGVGCAGGLSAVRTAADVACAATLRGRAARVLVYACEVPTALLRYDLAEAERCADPSDLNPAAAVLSDAAAALVLCNNDGLPRPGLPRPGLGGGDAGLGGAQFQLLDWKRAVVPHTHSDVGFFPDPNGRPAACCQEPRVLPSGLLLIQDTGYRTVLAKGVVLAYIKDLIQKMLPGLLTADRSTAGAASRDPADFDWALHPGSPVIVDGIKEMLGLKDHHIRATNEVYRTRGNSGSASVLAVLSQLRSMGPARDHIIGASYGPGVTVEMVKLRRCRGHGDGDGNGNE